MRPWRVATAAAAGGHRGDAGEHAPTRLPTAQRLLLAAVLLLLAGAWTPLDRAGLWPLHDAAFDAFQRLHPRTPDPSWQVRAVVIDERSLERHGQWPWPRTRLARLIEAVFAAGAVAVALDMVMPEADRLSPDRLVDMHPAVDPALAARLRELPGNDELLAATLALSGGVVVGRAGVRDLPRRSAALRHTPWVLQGGEAPAGLMHFGHILANVAPLEDAAAGRGLLNAVPDADGVVRRVPVVAVAGGELQPSMPLELLRVAFGEGYYTVHVGEAGVVAVSLGEHRMPLDADGGLTLHFSPGLEQRRLSAAALLDNEVAPGTLANAVAIIGVTGLGLADVPPTPVQGRMDGVEIQAQVAESLLGGSRLVRPSWAPFAETAALLAAGFALLLLSRGATAWSVPAGLLVLLAPPALAFGAFLQRGLLLDPAYAVLAAMLTWALAAALRRGVAERRRRALGAALEAERLQRARLDGELGAARDIQTAMLDAPANDERERPAGLDWHALVVPAREVGGDLYQVMTLADGRLFFIVGDVSGKGAAAALFMALTRALVGSAARRVAGGAGDILAAAQADLDRENPMALFVTAVCGVLDGASGELELVIAGHDAPLAVDTAGEVRELGGTGGPPLGVLEGFEYRSEPHRLAPGETLLLYTDGVTEAQDPAGRLFGHERLCELMRSLGGLPAAAVADRVRDGVLDFAAGAEPADDMTVLVIVRAPEAPA